MRIIKLQSVGGTERIKCFDVKEKRELKNGGGGQNCQGKISAEEIKHLSSNNPYLRVSIFCPFTKRVEVDVFLTPTPGVEPGPMLDAVENEANPDPKPLEAKTLVNPGIPMPPNGEKAEKKGSSILRWLRDVDVDEEPCRLEWLLLDLWWPCLKWLEWSEWDGPKKSANGSDPKNSRNTSSGFLNTNPNSPKGNSPKSSKSVCELLLCPLLRWWWCRWCPPEVDPPKPSLPNWS